VPAHRRRRLAGAVCAFRASPDINEAQLADLNAKKTDRGMVITLGRRAAAVRTALVDHGIGRERLAIRSRAMTARVGVN